MQWCHAAEEEGRGTDQRAVAEEAQDARQADATRTAEHNGDGHEASSASRRQRQVNPQRQEAEQNDDGTSACFSLRRRLAHGRLESDETAQLRQLGRLL